MTPQLYAKLAKQIERQTPELADYEARAIDRNIAALNLQPAIDAAQDALDAAQAALTEAQAVEGADTTAEQAAVTEAQAALDAAKAAQAKPEAERDQLQAQANTIRAAITQCKAELHGVDMPAEALDAYAASLEATKKRAAAKARRAEAVESIVVTTSAGHVFDGDETSQGRMARAIIALQATGTPSVRWVLADNTAIDAPVAELVEALALAGAAQAKLWVL
jgi:septal ring factor EnvC (AmiA/AmiB activator)